MTTDLKPYLIHRGVTRGLCSNVPLKPSGVEWLGDVPAHWTVRRLRTVATIINGATPSTNTPSYWNGEIPWLTPEDLGRLTTRYVESGTRQITQKGYNSCGTSLAPAGSLAISTRAPIGHLGILRSAACVNQGCRLLVPKQAVHSTYLYYMLKTARFELEALGQGSTFMELSQRKLTGFAVTVPPLPEQTAIARYLDYVDRRIRHYINAKQKLTSLLEEQRQTTIHRAVTRGLDPDVRLKSSGIPWLGEVPMHWESMPLKRLGRFRSGSGFPIDEQGKRGLDLPFFKVSDMNLPGNDRVMTIQNNSVSHSTARRLGATVFPAGTIVFPKVGGALLTNKRRVVERPCCIDNNLMGCVVRRGNPQFVLLLLEHIDLATIAKPGPVPAVSERELREIRTTIPPLPEQNAIVAYLGKATADLDTAIARTRRQIESLHEYRTRLIADVVTGKLDVREIAAKLPDTDPAPPDEAEASINAEGKAQR